MTKSDSWPSVKTANSGPSYQSNEDEIFEREYQAFMRNRDLTQKLIALEQLNEDVEDDECSPVNKPSPVAKAKPLGPEGTELIDETFRALPGECGVYPQRWVTHQSTMLQPQPTELSIS
jgi:hypothetical protein